MPPSPSKIAEIAMLLLLAVPCLYAQNDDDDASPARPYASLSLKFDNAGAVQATLSLWSPQKTINPAEHKLSDALARSLHCASTQFSRRWMPLPASWPLMSSDARQSWLTRRAKSEQNEISGTCSVLAHHAAWLNGQIEVAPLSRALRQSGFSFLLLHVETPRAPSHSLTPATLRTSSAFNQLGYFDDAFDLSESTPPAITIAYGVTQRDLVRALLITTAFVLLPLAFIAWMRAYALRNAATDPTAAWFSYFRTLHLTIQFATLAWIFADFHARNALSAWATYRWHLSTWTAVAADPLLMLGPIAALPVLSLLLSYDVFARIRRAAWGRPEFVAIHTLQLASVYLPLALLLVGIGILAQQPLMALLLMTSCFAVGAALRRLHGTLAGEVVQPVPSGELHDAVFDIARHAGVPLKGLLVRPAGKGQLSNAFAKGKATIIFTDYLLQNLSKREVRAIAAHEITHLQKKHPLKLALALMAAIFSPSIIRWLEDFAPRVVLSFVHSPEHLAAVYKVILAVHSVQQWALHDLFVAMLGFAGLYLLARRFEFQADAGAVQLTRDPEAKITALLKVSHLNLMPVRWGKGSSVWMTHPNTLHRLERIGRIGGMPPARVHELSESCTPESLTSEDHYDLPPVTNQVALSNPRLRAHLWLKSLLTVRR